MRILVFLVLLANLSVCSFAGNSNPDAILGTWLVEEKDGQIEIFKCGDKYCGKVVWLAKPTDKKGIARKDIKNPNALLRSRSLINMVFLENFAYDANANEWSGGLLYDARSGNSYSAYFTLNANGTLTLTGYILGIRRFNKSNTWTRIK